MRERVLAKVAPELAPRLRIQTIDAFCASLTRQVPVLARFGAQPGIVEDASAALRRGRRAHLARLSAPVARLLAHLDNNVGAATQLLARMLARRDQWLRKTGRRADARGAGGRACGRARAAAIAREGAARLGLARARRRGAHAARGMAPSPRRAARARRRSRGCRKRSRRCGSLPPDRYADTQWEALEAILALLNPAVAQLQRALRRARARWISPRWRTARSRALGTPDEPTDLMLALDVRMQHLLVDEFQDTSNSQWELLERLTAGWGPGDGAHRVRWSAIRCSRSTASAMRRWGSSCAPGTAGFRNVALESADALHQLPLAGRDRRLGQSRLFRGAASRRGRSLRRGAVFAVGSVRGRRRCEGEPALARLLRPRRRSPARGGASRRGAREDGDPGSQPQPPRPHRAGAEGRRRPLSRDRDRRSSARSRSCRTCTR